MDIPEEQSGRERDVLQRIAACLKIAYDPERILTAVEELVTKSDVNTETLQVYEDRYGTMHSQLNQLQQENFDLRKALNKAQLASEPAIVQVKQLLLDPAMNKEFSSLRGELESSRNEIRRLQGELDGLTFTQQSKAGRQLMAKCRKLQEENEEMGREISEGHVHELETQLTAARSYAEDLRRKFKELEAHCYALDEEAEDIQQQIFILKSQQEERSVRYRERSVTPRRMSPEYRDPPEMYERRRISHSMDRKRHLSEERGSGPGGGHPRDRSSGMSAHEDDREMASMRRRYK